MELSSQNSCYQTKNSSPSRLTDNQSGRRSPFRNLSKLNDLYSCPVIKIKLESNQPKSIFESNDKIDLRTEADRQSSPHKTLTGTSLMMIELLKKSKKEQLYNSSKKEYFDYLAPYRSQASIITGK
jgi:hypothetical protein